MTPVAHHHWQTTLWTPSPLLEQVSALISRNLVPDGQAHILLPLETIDGPPADGFCKAATGLGLRMLEELRSNKLRAQQ